MLQFSSPVTIDQTSDKNGALMPINMSAVTSTHLTTSTTQTIDTMLCTTMTLWQVLICTL